MNADVLDDFEDISSWSAVASGLAQLRISPERTAGRNAAMRLDFDFKGGGGFVVARRALARPMPESFTLSFAIRGAAPANRLELKLSDPSGRNVWWRHWTAFEPPADWRTVEVRSREIEFAWGPAGGGSIAELGAIELVLAAGPGGAGTVWIGDLRLEDRTYRATPVLTASSALPGHAPERVLDGSAATSWRSAPSDASAWLEMDFVDRRELGGFVISWVPGAQPRAFRIEASDDGATWRTLHAAEPADVARSYVYAPETECRLLRFTFETRRGAGGTAVGLGIAEIAVQPFAFSHSIHDFFGFVARDQPRGHHPRWLASEQSYWTSVGVPDGHTCAIVNEEGMVEVDRGSFSIEPFLRVDGRLLTWADAEIAQSLEDDWMPVPSSAWRIDDLALRTTAFAARHDGRAVLFLRYRVENAGRRARRIELFAALRPFQVNPPWQAFGELGGVRRIAEIAWDGRQVLVDRARAIVPLSAPAGFGAAAFEEGEIPAYLAAGTLPPRTSVADAFGFASGALAFSIELAPEATHDVFLAVPFEVGDADFAAGLADLSGAEVLDVVAQGWRDRFGAIATTLPASARDHADVARTAGAQVLVNRDGPKLQPGPRRYTRAWIRDGAVMATALLRLGRSAEAVEFVRWYAGFQAPDGNVPCCVDEKGPDWLVEHDSHGELIFAIAECFRFTGDRAFLAELWPAARKAAAYLDRLRAMRLTPEYDAPELRARRGLLPESASHEGYLAHPVHAYWDDFWALKAYRDAAGMAEALGKADEARALRASHDALGDALRASIELTIAERKIDYVPGSVEWADFDPAATAVAVSLLGALEDVPRPALERSFDEYMSGLRRRRRGEIDWNNYSAYEVRIVAALVHLGRRDDAAELADFLLGDRRPHAWNQWPEISWRNARSPGHIGDVPHTWIGAEWVLAFHSMLAYEREADASLVLAAGVAASWLDDGAEVGVAGLPTHYGELDFLLRREDARTLSLTIRGTLELPPGGIVVRPPLAGPLVAVEVDRGPIATFDAESATIRACPARVVLRS